MRPNCPPKFGDGDDRHVVHEVRDRAVRVTRDDRLQRAARQLAHEPEDLAAVVARRKIVRVRRSRRTSRRRASRARRARRRARATRVPRRAIVARERARREPFDVRGERLPQARFGHHADEADAHAGDLDDRRRRDVRPVHGLARRCIDDVRREERKVGARRGRLQRALHVAGAAPCTCRGSHCAAGARGSTGP